MKASRTFSQLKAEARNSLPGHLRSALGAVLFYLFTVIVLSGMPSSVAPDHQVLRPVFLLLLGFILNILIQMLGIGLRLRFMKLLFEQDPVPGDVTMAFRDDADRAVRLCGRRATFYILCDLPAFIYSMTLPQKTSLPQRLVFLLLFAAGCVAAQLIRLNLMCADYLYLEYPELPASSLLQTSRRLIAGNRLRLLCFYLSYLPLHLLALISLGLAEPLVLCYVYAGEAAFYSDLVRARTEGRGW